MILGLIGGAGSGKSAVAEILEKDYGFHIIQTDYVARSLMNENVELKNKLKEAFGTDIYTPEGTLDKKKFAALIYAFPEAREKSDRIVHPAVWAEVKRQLAEIPGANFAVETALPSVKLKEICNSTVYVRTDPQERIRRMMENRGYTRAQAQALLDNQKDDAWYNRFADAVLENSASLEQLKIRLAQMLACVQSYGR